MQKRELHDMTKLNQQVGGTSIIVLTLIIRQVGASYYQRVLSGLFAPKPDHDCYY